MKVFRIVTHGSILKNGSVMKNDELRMKNGSVMKNEEFRMKNEGFTIKILCLSTNHYQLKRTS
jgi:hypothetical protein